MKFKISNISKKNGVNKRFLTTYSFYNYFTTGSDIIVYLKFYLCFIYFENQYLLSPHCYKQGFQPKKKNSAKTIAATMYCGKNLVEFSVLKVQNYKFYFIMINNFSSLLFSQHFRIPPSPKCSHWFVFIFIYALLILKIHIYIPHIATTTNFFAKQIKGKFRKQG